MRRMQSTPTPTKNWVEPTGFQKNLDGISQNIDLQQLHEKYKDEIPVKISDAQYKQWVTDLVDAIFMLLNVDAAECPQARADCIEKCISCHILSCRKWGNLAFVRNPERARLLEQQVLATKVQHGLPFPEIGMLMIAKLLLRVEGTFKDTVSRVIREHFLFERAAMAAFVYDRDHCKGVFAIKDCPEKYCFPIAEEHHIQATLTATIDSDEGYDWSDHERRQEENLLNDNGIPSADMLKRGKARAACSLLEAGHNPTPNGDVIHLQRARKQTSGVSDSTSASGTNAAFQDAKRRRLNQRSDPTILPRQTCVLNDGRLIMSPEAVQKMFGALRTMQASLSGSHLGEAADAYNQIVLALPDDLQYTEDLTPIRGDTLSRAIIREKRAQGFGSNLVQIAKVVDELDKGATERCASAANEHLFIGNLKRLLFPLEE